MHFQQMFAYPPVMSPPPSFTAPRLPMPAPRKPCDEAASVTTASPGASPAASTTASPLASPAASPPASARGWPAALRAEEPATSAPESELPAVISVKKSAKGCAVVLLRNQEVLERAVKQAVAVVDGVCVEVRRHTQKRVYEDSEPQIGIFVAWGHRVERKVSVSAEGLEDYFNALARLPEPEGLEAKAPFDEACLRFLLRSSPAPRPLNAAAGARDDAERARLLSGATCEASLVEKLWKAKGRLDDLWNIPPPPLARSLMSRVARAQLFPHSGEGGKEHENRAGDKLAELSAAVGLLDGLPRGSAFLDLCGGPGAWSQHLLEHGEELTGFGFTLRSEAGGSEDWQAEEKDQWYPELSRDSRWRALWGADGTGDLLKPGNVQHAAKRLAKEKVMLVAADGGFSDKAIPANLLELYFYRLFLGEILMASLCLREGGRFVCKLYTTLSGATSALLYVLTRLFDRVEIVKPKSSRVTGPERYLACFGFRASSQETADLRAALLKAHEAPKGASPLTAPLLQPCIAAGDLAEDAVFTESVRAMSQALCQRQARALEAVVDRAEFLEEMAMAVGRSAGARERPVEYKAPEEPRKTRTERPEGGRRWDKGGRRAAAAPEAGFELYSRGAVREW